MVKTQKETVQIVKGLADETRMEIIGMLSGGELCACKILKNFNITQPTLSYHMRILTECGLVCGRRDGASMRYSLNKQSFEAIRNFFDDICKEIAEDESADCGEDC